MSFIQLWVNTKQLDHCGAQYECKHAGGLFKCHVIYLASDITSRIGLYYTDLKIWHEPVRCQSLKNMRCENNFQEKKIQRGIPYLRIFKGIQISLHVIANSIAFHLLFVTALDAINSLN